MFVKITQMLMKYIFCFLELEETYEPDLKTNKRDMISLQKFLAPYSALLFLLELDPEASGMEMDFSILSCT